MREAIFPKDTKWGESGVGYCLGLSPELNLAVDRAKNLAAPVADMVVACVEVSDRGF